MVLDAGAKVWIEKGNEELAGQNLVQLCKRGLFCKVEHALCIDFQQTTKIRLCSSKNENPIAFFEKQLN